MWVAFLYTVVMMEPSGSRWTKHIRRALINNGYPRGVLQHHATPAPMRPADDHSRGPVITLPYVRGLSEAVRRVLTPLGLRVSFRPNTTLKQLLVRPKDRTPTEELAGVVYQVPCASCPASYGTCHKKLYKIRRNPWKFRAESTKLLCSYPRNCSTTSAESVSHFRGMIPRYPQNDTSLSVE